MPRLRPRATPTPMIATIARSIQLNGNDVTVAALINGHSVYRFETARVTTHWAAQRVGSVAGNVPCEDRLSPRPRESLPKQPATGTLQRAKNALARARVIVTVLPLLYT